MLLSPQGASPAGPRSPYQRGGIVTQHKGSKTLAFKPLAQAIQEPGEFLLSDFSKARVTRVSRRMFHAYDVRSLRCRGGCCNECWYRSCRAAVWAASYRRPRQRSTPLVAAFACASLSCAHLRFPPFPPLPPPRSWSAPPCFTSASRRSTASRPPAAACPSRAARRMPPRSSPLPRPSTTPPPTRCGRLACTLVGLQPNPATSYLAVACLGPAGALPRSADVCEGAQGCSAGQRCVGAATPGVRPPCRLWQMPWLVPHLSAGWPPTIHPPPSSTTPTHSPRAGRAG